MMNILSKKSYFYTEINKKDLNEYSSKLLERAVQELSHLPGIGQRTALRLALYLLHEDPPVTQKLADALVKMRNEIHFCRRCYNISDTDICEICSNPKRDENTLCIVADTRDVFAVENTAQFNGLYHVLGGIINPMEGVGPGDLHITPLIERVNKEEVKEIILALPATVEGDTTGFYLFKLLSPFDITITTIARGVAVGNELEYTDEVTLGRSILNRLPFDNKKS